MAIAFRVAGTVANGTGTSVTVTVPAVTNGDVMLAFIEHNKTEAVTPPAGWTVAYSEARTTILQLDVYYRIAASEPGTYDWSWATSVVYRGVIMAWSGVDAGTPLDCASASQDGAAINAVAPALTTVTANAWMVCAWVASTSIAEPVSMAERLYYATNPRLEVADEIIAVAGATGTRTATLGSAVSYLAGSLALRPAPAGMLLLNYGRDGKQRGIRL